MSERIAGLPHWAQWNPAAAARPWTVGIEEEIVLLDPRSWSVANRIDEVLDALPADVAGRASAETHACVLELRTGPHPTVADAIAELEWLRLVVDRTLRDRLRLRAAVIGTHPLATRSEVAIASGRRYQEIDATMRALAHREPTMAQHVHVAVPDAAAAVRALDGLRADLPLLLALSANSPYWRARDAGFASVRTPVFSMFPRTGTARHFGTYERYVRAIDPMVRSGAIPDPGFVWWDARLRPTLGTVEVRIMDAQTQLADAGALAAVVHCLVRRYAQSRRLVSVASELLAENRFLAARDGTAARLIDGRAGRRIPASAALDELLARCEPFADGLDCGSELAAAAALADDPGYARQRAHTVRHGLGELPAWLAEAFTAPGRHAVPAAGTTAA